MHVMNLRKPSIRITRITFVIFCLLPIFFANGQGQNHLVQAGSFDHTESYQFISDSIVRVFGISGWGEGYRNGSGFIADYNLFKPLAEVQPQIIGQGECFFNYGITDLYQLFLNDGSSIIGLNPFDCDYWPEGGIVRLNSEGSLDWILDFTELE